MSGPTPTSGTVTGPTASEPASPLLHEHEAAGATMTRFAGWRMPLRFGSELAEHRAVRTSAGVFDLSHMAQLEVSGPDAPTALDRSLASVVSTLALGRARYTVLVAADGGILDDLIAYRLGEGEFLVVANAANRTIVRDALTERSDGLRAAVVDRTLHRALVGVQGPASAAVLAPLTPVDLTTLRYYGTTQGSVAGAPALIARTGYTGEDGFELSLPAPSARRVWQALLESGQGAGAVPCGLACRDSLRLEAGMALYGHEMDASVTPFEAGLGRVVHLDHEFVGRAALAERAAHPTGVGLVGLLGTGRRAARGGNPVLAAGVEIGTVTSGALSPTLGRPIALARVSLDDAPRGMKLEVDVRGLHQVFEVVDPPFYRRPR